MIDIQLLRGIDNEPVDATLLPVNRKHLDDFEQFWKGLLRVSEEEDAYWDWVKKERLYASSSSFEKYAIECEQMTQGLMMIETQGHRSWFDADQRIVYVDFLATAPWNRLSFQSPPNYRTVGSILLKFARYRSQELGYGGRVGLHALSRAKPFYEKVGMIDCGEDAEKENLPYFEWYRQRPSKTDIG